MEYFADLHIHSCLSPCGDEDMTPANICGMAKLKGLDAIAICDHNSARNLPAAQELCDAYGLLLLPGMEITTREEVHLLGYFETVEAALAFGEMLRGHLPNKKNKPQFFGRQLVMNSDDEIIGEEEALRYLRRQEIAAAGLSEGMNLVCVRGRGLGFAKRIGSRVNNLYPNSLRIMKQ